MGADLRLMRQVCLSSSCNGHQVPQWPRPKLFFQRCAISKAEHLGAMVREQCASTCMQHVGLDVESKLETNTCRPEAQQSEAVGFHPLKKNGIVKEQIDITDDLVEYVESKCAGGCCFAIGFVCLVVCLSTKFLASLPLLVVPLFCVALLLH